MEKKGSKKSGFHILELLFVVGAVGILISLVILVVNPSDQLSRSRNAQRKEDINTIIKAVYDYKNKFGTLPPSISGVPREICRFESKNCQNLVNLSALVDANILETIPIDYAMASDNGAGYGMFKTGNKLTITAPGAEKGEIIELMR